jgi:hypothetical protein
MVALAREGVGGRAGVGGVGAATAAAALDDRVDCERVWVAVGEDR